jgi:hypothetical protein
VRAPQPQRLLKAVPVVRTETAAQAAQESGVKCGDKITAIVKGKLAMVRLLDGPLSFTWNVRVYRERSSSGSIFSGSSYPLKKTWTVSLEPRLEGITWAQGWQGEAASALRVAVALR